MPGPGLSRRGLVATCLAAAGALAARRRVSALAPPAEVTLPDHLPVEALEFETKGIDGWTVVEGRWVVEDMAGAPRGRKVLVQRATTNEFNVILTPLRPYRDVDVTMKFRPIAGREDASGGVVFRFNDRKYYVVRANALEGNFRLYSYDRGRRQIATATVKPPALGQWHTVRLVAVGDHIQAWLDGMFLLDHRDGRFTSGRVGLWTKADSITAFDGLVVRGLPAGD
jgi:hypothetical protein